MGLFGGGRGEGVGFHPNIEQRNRKCNQGRSIEADSGEGGKVYNINSYLTINK